MVSNAVKTTTVNILLIGLFTAGQQVLPVSAQAFDMVDESTVWIEGTSTVNSFVCATDEVAGSGTLSVPADESPAETPVVSTSAEGRDDGDEDDGDDTDDQAAKMPAEDISGDVVVRVPATRLDCGLPAMNRDLRESLKVDSQPTIDFRLDRTEVIASPEQNNGLYIIRAYGWLSLAGNERQVDVLLEGERSESGELRGWGSKNLKMSDFGIKPPSALFGLVRAHDDITVRFNFIAEPSSTAKK